MNLRLPFHTAFLILSAGLWMPRSASAAPPAGYYLVWSDEFNGTSLNTTYWEYARNGSRFSGYNTSSAVAVSNGCLVITTYSAGGTNFTGFVDTYKSPTPVLAGYGYYEVSMQCSNAPGQWSAFWLQTPWMMNVQPDGTLGNTNYNPTNGVEIDVFEHRCVDGSGSSWVNGGNHALHWNGYGSQEQSAVWSSSSLGVGTGFHTYGLLWSTNSYKFYVDDNLTWSTTKYMISSAQQFIRLTSEVESNSWAGTVPPGGYPSKAQSQVKTYFDYVRYYAPTNVQFWSGTRSPYWSTAGNWVSNLLPTATSDVIFSYFTLGNRSMALGNDYIVNSLNFLAANGSSAFSMAAGNTLTLGPGGINMNAANYNVTLNNAVRVATNQVWVVSPSLTINGNLSGSGILTKSGPGTLILNASNSFAGTLNVDAGGTGDDGALALANPKAANSLTSVWIRNTNLGTSKLLLSNSVVIPCGVNLAGRNSGTVAIQSGSGLANTLSGGLTLAGGGSNYCLQADYSTLSIGGTVSAGSTASGNRLLTLQGAASFSIPGSIQNGSATALSIVKTNAGTLTLSGTNTYTGSTTNWRGVLIVNGSVAGPLVLNGGFLSGTGSVAGATSIKTACELTPGLGIANSIGTLSFGSSLTLASGSTTFMEIDAAAQTNDMFTVSGTLNCGGALYISNLAGSPAPGQSFRLFKAGSYLGAFASVTLPTLDPGLAWNTNNLYKGVLSVIAVSPAEILGVTNFSNGGMQLSWDYGVLQSSTNVIGPFSDVSNAVSPLTVFMANSQMFYRIQEQ